ncbi:MAG TPA: LeuA family protein [Anaerolineae bacterium]|nr:LeuA family protein [Anaerolineae bacterium]HPL27717.1 LeuA family protein [Anaerolineae bacterium]
MSSEPWKTEQWFVSPWNFAPEVMASLRFPDRILIHDVTLRDGAQQAGVVFTKDDKLRIAEKLAEAGVHRIEAGLPAISPQDDAAIREIVRRNLGPQIFGFSRCMVEDVKRVVATGVTGVVMEIPSSKHIIEKAYRWPLERAIQASIEATAYAHSQGLEVVFFPIDFTRADLDWVLNLITRVATEGHMDALGLVDTFGVTSPHAMPYFVRQVRKRVDKRLEAHFHMDFGVGVANTIMALAEGVEVIHSTVLGIGERAGNTPLEETALALLTLYGIDLGIRYEKLYELAHLVSELAGHPVPSSHPVIGSGLFDIESGILASWWKSCRDADPTEVFPFLWNVVGGHPGRVVMGPGSGLDSVHLWLEELGLTASDAQMTEILAKVKQFGYDHKRLLSYDDFQAIAAQVLGLEPA